MEWRDEGRVEGRQDGHKPSSKNRGDRRVQRLGPWMGGGARAARRETIRFTASIPAVPHPEAPAAGCRRPRHMVIE